jgi:hypothetical protein
MRTEGTFAAIGFALVTLGIAAAFLPARGMTLNQCKRAHAGYCAYRLAGGERDWEPGLREHGSRHAAEVVPVLCAGSMRCCTTLIRRVGVPYRRRQIGSPIGMTPLQTESTRSTGT